MSEHEPARTCAWCGERFRRAQHRALHAARDHADVVGFDERREAWEAWLEEERFLFALRRHAWAVLRVVPLLMAAFGMVVLAVSSRVNLGLAFLPVPGVLLTTAVLYYVSYEGAGEGGGPPDPSAEDLDAWARTGAPPHAS